MEKNISAKEMKQYKDNLIREYFNNLEVMINNKPITDSILKDVDFKKRDYENKLKKTSLQKRLFIMKSKNQELFIEGDKSAKNMLKIKGFKGWQEEKVKQDIEECDLDHEVLMMQKNAFEALMGDKEMQIHKQNDIIKARTKEVEDAFTKWGKPELVINEKSTELKSRIKELWGIEL